MFTICRKALCALLLVVMAGASLGCVNIGSPPERERKSEVKIGGDKGVVVDHPDRDTDNDRH